MAWITGLLPFVFNLILNCLMTKYLITLLILAPAMISSCNNDGGNNEQNHLLVYTKANISVHEAIQTGTETIRDIADQHGLQVTVTDDSTMFRSDNLSQYSAIIFANTSGEILDDEGKAAFKEYIQNGGGFAGIHAASTTEYNWEWYGNMVGNYFDGHPAIQTATLNIHDHSHPSTSHLPEEWVWEDEYYNWQHTLSDDITVLMSVDESTYEGGTSGDLHPVTWYHEYDGGRAWYTSLGHGAEYYSDPQFVRLLEGGILWAAGLE